MTIINLEKKGGYEEYAYDITGYMKKVFMGVKKAWLCFYANNMKEAREKAKEYWKEKDIKRQDFEADADTIILELENGKVIKLWNSEWGGVSVLSNSVVGYNNYNQLVEKKQ